MHLLRRLAPLSALALLVSALLVPATYAQTPRPVEPKFDGHFAADTPPVSHATGEAYAPGQLIVRVRDGSRLLGADNTLATFGGRWGGFGITAALSVAPGTYRLSVAGDDMEALATHVAADPEVLWAQPNYLRHVTRSLNDPLSTFQYSIAKTAAVGAWDITTGSADVLIAIVDTGISLGHPEFAGRIVQGYDFANGDSDPNDDNGHGTHVSGIAAAAGDNGEGIAGMCWQCRILPVKVFGSNGSGSDAEVAEGIRFAVDKGARIINLSLGGTQPSPLLQEAVRYAAENNALVVAAAGNEYDDGNPIAYPAAYDEVLAVAATDENDQRATFSNVHPYVDIAAPGWNIASTWADVTFPSVPYLALTGTSMSAPNVAGLAGLLLSVNPQLDVNALRTAITANADDLGQPGLDWEFGAGRINAQRAVASVKTPVFEPVANPNQPDVLWFGETQHTLRGPFRQFWEENGGIPVFGFPVTEEFSQTTPEGTFTVQYFERNRFELHSEKPAPYNVLLGRLSDVQLREQGRDWFAFPKGQPQDGCQFFAETEHSVCEPFLSYWRGNGLRDLQLDAYGRSLALFGLPLSEPAQETNESGQTVLTQWFERARLEYHPANPPQYQLLQGLLGNETAVPGGSTTPESGQPPADRCGAVPGPAAATVYPSACVLHSTYVVLEFAGFLPDEEVTFTRVAQGQTVDQFTERVDEQGKIVASGVAEFPADLYAFAVTGSQSGNQSVVYLKIVDR